VSVAGAGKRWAGSGASTSGSGGPRFKLAITGIPKVDRALNALEPKVRRKVLSRAMGAGMKPVQARVKAEIAAATPNPTVSGRPSQSTGATVRGVKVRATRGGRKSVGIDVRINQGAYVDKTFYAAFREFGTRKLPATHAMKRAFDATKRRARLEITIGIRKGALAEAAALGRSR